MSRIVIKGGSEAAAGDYVLRRPEPNNPDMIKFRLLTPGETAPRRAHSSLTYFSLDACLGACVLYTAVWMGVPPRIFWVATMIRVPYRTNLSSIF